MNDVPLTRREAARVIVRLAIAALLVTVALWGTGCAGNFCLIDAHIQQHRLQQAGIPARVALVDQSDMPHAYCVWQCRGEVYYWDGRGSRCTSATNLDDVAALEASWRLWRDQNTRFLAWDNAGAEARQDRAEEVRP